MRTFKNILAWVIVVISVLGILICMLGILGSWMVNERLTTRILNLLSGAQAALSRVENSLELASTQLSSANSAILTARQAVADLGDQFESNSPVLDTVISTLQERVGPAISRVREIFLEIEDRVQTVNSAIEMLNSLPAVQIPILSFDLQGVREKVQAVEEAVQELQQNILDFRAGIVQRLAPFGEKIDAIAAFLTQLEEDVSRYLSQVRGIQAALTKVKSNIPAVIDNISIGLTIVFLWSILTQVSLVLLAGLYLRTGRMVWEIPDSGQTSETAPAASSL